MLSSSNIYTVRKVLLYEPFRGPFKGTGPAKSVFYLFYFFKKLGGKVLVMFSLININRKLLFVFSEHLCAVPVQQ